MFLPFAFFPGLSDVVAAELPFLVLFISSALLVAVGVVLHGVFRCSNPDDHMRYVMRWCVWEYESCLSLAPLLSRASDTRVKMPR